jgi:DNA-binding transcriptional regulator of glucitol operon
MFSSFVGGERHFDYFPFLRRYQPAASFPLFLLFLIVVCRFLVRRQRPILSGILAAGILLLLVFSYFYLWTAALAWLAAIALLWLISRPHDRAILMRFLAVVGGITTGALIPYFIMISHSAETTRNVQSLVMSRKPDLFSAAELLGAVVLFILAFGIRKNLRLDDGRVIAAASFALLPFIVLNQQIITGRVLQPIHYKGFVTSYAVLISFVILAGLNWPRRNGGSWQVSKRALVWIAIAAFEWAAIEAYQSAKRNAVENDRVAHGMSVYAYFADQARKASRPNSDEVMLFDDLGMADEAPAASPFPVLWAPHMVVYPGVASTESKERLYKHLYYTGVGVKELDAYFHGETICVGCAVGLFGFDRFIDGLNPNAKPITRDEMNAELTAYARYIETFDKQRASSPRISHVIIRTDSQTKLENLDRWYQRDTGEQVGKFTIYRIKLLDHLEDTAVSRPASRF